MSSMSLSLALILCLAVLPFIYGQEQGAVPPSQASPMPTAAAIAQSQQQLNSVVAGTAMDYDPTEFLPYIYMMRSNSDLSRFFKNWLYYNAVMGGDMFAL